MTAAPLDPDLRGVVAAFVAAQARFVVIGGFAVVAHRRVRATEDVDLLVPEDAANDPPLDFATASADALSADLGDGDFLVPAWLPSSRSSASRTGRATART